MNPQKAHKLGVKASDVEITTKPNSRILPTWEKWIAWVPNEGRPGGKQILTESFDVGRLLYWRNQLQEFNDGKS